jgi:L-serine dehydratase
MFLSVFDIFKIGIGPSSSHTMGPMTAAVRFLRALRDHTEANNERPMPASLRVTLFGSLAFTGKGHATDRAVAIGLLGYTPADLDPDEAERKLVDLQQGRVLLPVGLPQLAFDPRADIVFNYGPALPGHANGLVFEAFDSGNTLSFTETFYSIGGGFVVTAAERESPESRSVGDVAPWPYPFDSAVAMLRMSRKSGLSIAAMKRENELVMRAPRDFEEGVSRIWTTMNGCIDRGLVRDGELPGGLRVKRRAKKILEKLQYERGSNRSQPHVASDWLSVYAMAVNEENAAGGKVVTAPTNGAAGVVPAVLRYYLNHCVGGDPARVSEFLLTAAAIGGLIKNNASISGAEAGCQGEVGSAAAMAAAGLCAVLGGTPEQVENAAEIALEHHLGMTCDPVAGLVQVPCIERNGMGAIKAVAAASLALRGDGIHFMPLDNCIEAMRQTGEEMNTKYKETSLGGLAVNIPEC